ncbi:MAG: GAF domain-containing protein [Anaerolineae bacterium]|nr:GAF domain-containing protein [Anaerolineae bacterium]
MATDYPFQVDLTNCDKEPIHIPGRIQPHGFLIVCHMPDLAIVQVSDNTAVHINASPDELLAQTLSELLNSPIIERLVTAWQADNFQNFNPTTVKLTPATTAFNLIAHRRQEQLLLEFEPLSPEITSLQFYNVLSHILQTIQDADTLEVLFQTSAEQIKQLTGFDRVMVYRFDEDWHGQVIAEAKAARLEPFLGLHFPASDIPAQARQLYTINRVRNIVDVAAVPANLTPLLTPPANQPLDLTHAVLRAVSPIHIEYLRNMGVVATMSISIIHNGHLWGLFACHHYAPKFVDYNMRNICEFISHIFSGQLPPMLAAAEHHLADQLAAVGETLLEQMSRSLDIISGLVDYPVTLLNLNHSSGAAIHFNNQLILHGQTPDRHRVLNLLDWLSQRGEKDLYHTDKLSAVYQPAQTYTATAAGLLALPLSKFTGDWMLWFKPEKLQTVEWAGNPEKAVTVEADGLRLSPRKSFKQWTEIVHAKSLPWQPAELNAARKLREHITNVIVQYTSHIQTVNAQLTKAYDELDAFSYSVSHDLRSPLRIIDSYSEILREDYYDQLDEAGREVLTTITKNTSKMNQLIEDMLAYSRLGRAEKIYNMLDLNSLIQDAVELVLENEKGRHITFDIEPLPKLYGDRPLIQQLFFNIISNAVKYTRPTSQPRIEISGQRQSDEVIYAVKDNGIGFEMAYADEIFKVFSRLHDSDTEFEGTGIGLALVKRIIQSHQGRIWVESQPGQGTTVYMAFPVSPADK